MNNLVCLLVAFFAVAHSQLCSQMACGPADQCCGDILQQKGVCYDPTTHKCERNTLCGVNDHVCNGICHKSTHKCAGKPGTSGVLCAAHEEACHDQYQSRGVCYDPSLYQCSNGNIICKIEHVGCNDQYLGHPVCFDPSKFHCAAGGNILCQRGDEGCYDAELKHHVCYEPEIYQCFNNEKLCMHHERGCNDDYIGYPVCYDPSTHHCTTSPTRRLCAMGYEVCANGQCYDPSRYTCIGNTLEPITGADFTQPATDFGFQPWSGGVRGYHRSGDL